MKSYADWLLAAITILIGAFILFGMVPGYKIERSSITGVCYEVRTSVGLISVTHAMSAVDDKWCEGK